jgi:hypothetical protein
MHTGNTSMVPDDLSSPFCHDELPQLMSLRTLKAGAVECYLSALVLQCSVWLGFRYHPQSGPSPRVAAAADPAPPEPWRDSGLCQTKD